MSGGRADDQKTIVVDTFGDPLDLHVGILDHHVPAARLTRGYFRRWWFGKGYSKAVFEAAQPITELGLDLRTVPHLGGVPRFMIVDGLRDALACLRALAAGQPEKQMRRAMRR